MQLSRAGKKERFNQMPRIHLGEFVSASFPVPQVPVHTSPAGYVGSGIVNHLNKTDGVGEFIPASFPVPQNPIKAGLSGCGCGGGGSCGGSCGCGGGGLGAITMPDGADLLSPSTWHWMEWAGAGLLAYFALDMAMSGKVAATRRHVSSAASGGGLVLPVVLVGGAIAATWYFTNNPLTIGGKVL